MILDEIPVEEIAQYINSNLPVIAFVNTADLPYWSTDTDHAVVVVGIEENNILLNDPFFAGKTQKVSRTSFQLAQLRFNHLCAVIQV